MWAHELLVHLYIWLGSWSIQVLEKQIGIVSFTTEVSLSFSNLACDQALVRAQAPAASPRARNRVVKPRDKKVTLSWHLFTRPFPPDRLTLRRSRSWLKGKPARRLTLTLPYMPTRIRSVLCLPCLNKTFSRFSDRRSLFNMFILFSQWTTT